MRYLRNSVKAGVSFISVASIASVITKLAVGADLMALCAVIERDFRRCKAAPRELFSPLRRTVFIYADDEEKLALAALSKRL